jgi:hypothetical protein
LSGLLKRVLIENGSANDVSQVGIRMGAEISMKSAVAGKPQKFFFDNVGRAQVASRHNAGPKCPEAFSDGIGGPKERTNTISRPR